MVANGKPTTLFELLANVAVAKEKHGIPIFIPTKTDKEKEAMLATAHELIAQTISQERSNGCPNCDEWVLLLEVYHNNAQTAALAYGNLRIQVPHSVIEVCKKKLGLS